MNQEERTMLTDHEVAESYGLTVYCVRRWRYEGRGPKFLRLGGAIRYRAKDVQEFMDSCVVLPGEQSNQQLAAQ